MREHAEQSNDSNKRLSICHFKKCEEISEKTEYCVTEKNTKNGCEWKKKREHTVAIETKSLAASPH